MDGGDFIKPLPFIGTKVILYALCFESDGRYFRAERPIRLSNAEIYRQIREHMEKVNLDVYKRQH